MWCKTSSSSNPILYNTSYINRQRILLKDLVCVYIAKDGHEISTSSSKPF